MVRENEKETFKMAAGTIPAIKISRSTALGLGASSGRESNKQARPSPDIKCCLYSPVAEPDTLPLDRGVRV